jgi:hypothetical protein
LRSATPEELAAFGLPYHKLLGRYRIPSEKTLRSVLGRLDPGEISAAGLDYLRPLLSAPSRRPGPDMATERKWSSETVYAITDLPADNWPRSGASSAWNGDRSSMASEHLLAHSSSGSDEPKCAHPAVMGVRRARRTTPSCSSWALSRVTFDAPACPDWASAGTRTRRPQPTGR